MIEELLRLNEGKTLEFKENADSLDRVVKTAIAFANTAGGTILIGVRDKTKEIVGVEKALDDEERIANALAHRIKPLLIPDIEIATFRDRQLIIIRIAHGAGPFHIEGVGLEKGTYVRFGSTNRVADSEMLQALSLLTKQTTFDELPCLEAEESDIDWESVHLAFTNANKVFTKEKEQDLGFTVTKAHHTYPTNGGILLYGKKRLKYFPDALIRCARFQGIDREVIIDEAEIIQHLPLAVDPVVSFIQRNIQTRIEIERIAHTKVPQYPLSAIREAVINAIVHADYAMKGTNITIAIFSDRIEITNPGALMFGLTLERALAGSSRLRNRVIGRVFKELGLIEQWGSGLKRIIAQCMRLGLPRPHFEELYNQFRLTIHGIRAEPISLDPWQEVLVDYLRRHDKISPIQAARLWKITSRTARSRLKELVEMGLLLRIATAEKDPTAFYVLLFDPGESYKIE